MSADEKAPQKNREIEYRLPPEGIRRMYSNNVSLSSTRFDLKIMFGELIEVTEEKAFVENRVQVTLTWLEAKALGEFLQVNIKAFEEMNGPLKLPNIPQQMVVPNTFPEAK